MKQEQLTIQKHNETITNNKQNRNNMKRTNNKQSKNKMEHNR